MENIEPKFNINYYIKLVLCLLFLFANILSVLYFTKFRAPDNFPLGSIFTITNGSGLNSLADKLYSVNVIRSPFWFKTFSVLIGGTKGVVAGDYMLDERENIFILANRMKNADYKLERVKITIPEGLNIYEIAKVVSVKLIKITEQNFIDKAKNLEGHLFPDTYIFQTNTGVYTVIEEMQANFKKRILALADSIKKSGHTESDIIKMASIIEEEGRTTETRKIISGILWKRLSLGIPLQVDSSFKYINGKATSDLTLADLKIDSKYNSYLYKGLPPTPICNPGIDSIMAAINPTKTDYLYFLTDKNSVMHYAQTFQEHIVNKQKYLP